MELDGFATGLWCAWTTGDPPRSTATRRTPPALGAAGVLEQASVLDLYDPSRARMCRSRNAPSTLEKCTASFANARADRGSKLRLLLAPTSSPLVEDLLGAHRSAISGGPFHLPTRPFSTSESSRGDNWPSALRRSRSTTSPAREPWYPLRATFWRKVPARSATRETSRAFDVRRIPATR